MQRVGHVLCQGVLLATVGDQTVSVEHHCIVFTDLALDIDIGDAGVGRQQLAEFLVVQLFPNILRSGELAVERQQLLLVLGGLGQVEAGCRLHVRQQVLALVAGDVLIHIAQLAFDHAQTVTDELRGADGDLVLVLYPFLVIYLDEGVQDIFRLLYGGIIDAQVDDGGILAAQIRTQGGRIIIGDGTHAAFSIADGSSHE